MKQHFATDAGKELVKKIGLVYQFQIAPKVLFFLRFLFYFRFKLIPKLCSVFFFLWICRKLELMKLCILLISRKERLPKASFIFHFQFICLKLWILCLCLLSILLIQSNFMINFLKRIFYVFTIIYLIMSRF